MCLKKKNEEKNENENDEHGFSYLKKCVLQIEIKASMSNLFIYFSTSSSETCLPNYFIKT